jgi:ribosomal protein S18 acetylase RimI-like enzyme
MDDFYKKIEWKIESNNSLYVHRLAINPKFQGNGYAKYVMSFIENIGKKNNSKSVRLDTFSLNEKNNKFYSNLGYLKLGHIYFRDQSDMPFNCYEKLLK